MSEVDEARGRVAEAQTRKAAIVAARLEQLAVTRRDFEAAEAEVERAQQVLEKAIHRQRREAS